MIPVIVGDQQAVDVRQVMDGAGGGSGKGFRAEGNGGGVVAEHGVDEKSMTSQLQKEGGMSQPDDKILRGVLSPEVGTHGRNGAGRDGAGSFFRQRTDERPRKAAVVAENGAGNEIAELAVDVVRRRLESFQVRAFRQCSELFLTKKGHDSSRPRSCDEGRACHDAEKGSSFHEDDAPSLRSPLPRR